MCCFVGQSAAISDGSGGIRGVCVMAGGASKGKSAVPRGGGGELHKQHNLCVFGRPEQQCGSQRGVDLIK